MVCNVTGTAISPNGAIKPGAKITFRRAQLDVVSQEGSFVIPDDYIIQTALDGTVNFDILPGVYDATTVAVGGRTVAFRVSVPNEPAADFADLLNASYVEIPPASVTQAQQARDAAIAARAAAELARDEAVLYDGPKVDTFAELAAITPAMLPVGALIRVVETGAVYRRVSSGGMPGIAAPMVPVIGANGFLTAAQVGAFPLSESDATAALQWAIDYLSAQPNGGGLSIPSGVYYISSLRLMPNVEIHGVSSKAFSEGSLAGGSQLRQISGVSAPMLFNDPDTSGGYLRSVANSNNEGDQYYYNNTLRGLVIDARSSGNADTRCDALRLERAWGVRVADCVFLAGRRSFAWRLIDCNVLWLEGNTVMGPSFMWSVADSIVIGNQMGGAAGTAAQNHFWPVLWMAGAYCWKNLLSNNMPFNNTANVGGQTWTFTASGSLLTLSGSHEFQDGDPVCLETTGALPSGVTARDVYFIKRVSSTQVRLATFVKNVKAGVFVSLSGGSGTHTIRGGANCNMFVQSASRNSFVGHRWDQAFGAGVILRGATLNTIVGGTVMENGLGSGSTVRGISIEVGSNDNVIQGVILDGAANGSTTQVVGIFEDATCLRNRIDVITQNHSSGNLILSGEPRFVDGHVFFGTDSLESMSGSPAIGAVGGGRRNAWLMDASTDEVIGVEFFMPAEWKRIKISIYWVNAGAGSGNAAFSYNLGQYGVGSSLNVADTQNSFVHTFASAAQDVLSISKIPDQHNITAGEMTWLRIKRDGTNVADTLPNDLGIIGVRIDRVL